MTTPTATDQRDVSSQATVWGFIAREIAIGRLPGPESVVFVDHRDKSPLARATVSLNFTDRAHVEAWLASLEDPAVRPDIRFASAHGYGWSWLFGWSK